MKIMDLNAFFKKLPSIESDDQIEFEKDIKPIRSQSTFEDKSWDCSLLFNDFVIV
jgi:hypothetical protein